MNDAPLNSEREQAERLDAWIAAAQAGGPPENDTVAELQALVRIGRAIRADDTFARQLEAQLFRRHHRRRHRTARRWLGLAAAALVAILLAAGVFRALPPGERPQPTEAESSVTPVALAATSTLAVEIDLTNGAILPLPTATATATTTATPTPPPSTTLVPLLPTITRLPSTTPMSVPPSPTLLPTATLLPAVATIVPAVNPTSLPIFQHAQVDVLFVVDSGAGVMELESRLTDLFSQIAALPTLPDTRFGLVIVNGNSAQTVDFTYDSGVLLAALQTAEAVPGAWVDRVSGARVSWRENGTIKLIIGIGLDLDAAYTLPLQQITAQGIRLGLIVSDDVNDQDALIFQQITGGHFVELAGSDYTHWIVQWIAEELAALRSS